MSTDNKRSLCMMYRQLTSIIAIVCAVIPHIVETANDELSVKVTEGYIQGTIVKSFRGYPVNAYLGVPYATPPIGDLRFEDPQPVSSWDGERDATHMPMPCPQILIPPESNGTSIVGSEDCLYLNIYVPTKTDRKKLPVMVFLHGGGFFFGGAGAYTHKQFSDEEVVLVNIQYRIGVLGFLSTEDSAMKGNYGLKDQQLAFKWIKDNIENFRGDPKRITIFGHSAGGASVHLHLLSPSSNGLFQRAIAQSGNALCPWARGKSHRKFAEELGKTVGCPLTDDSQKYLKCLRIVDQNKLVEYHQMTMPFFGSENLMAPRVDGEFLPDQPENLIIKGEFNTDVVFMLGVVKDEGAVSVLSGGSYYTQKNIDDMIEQLPLALYLPKNQTAISKKVLELYNLDKLEKGEADMDAYVKMVGDRLFNIAHAITVAQHARHTKKNLYTYLFDYKPLTQMEDFLSSVPNRYIAHGEELRFLFNAGGYFPSQLRKSDDLFMKTILMDLWSAFARSGDPSSSPKPMFKWTPTTLQNYKQAQLNLMPRMIDIEEPEHSSFWTQIPYLENSMDELVKEEL